MERGNARLKFFDRWFGPVLLMLIAPMRLIRASTQPSNVRTVGILKTAAIGDTVLVSAIIDDIRASHPSASIVLFVGASNAAFAGRLKGVDEIVQLPLANPFMAVKQIRSNKFDLFIDMDSWPRISALLTALSRSSFRVGFKTSGQHRHYVYDQAVIHRRDQHELENYRALARVTGVRSSSLPQVFGHGWLGRSRTIVFHLWPSGTQSYLKQWAGENWVRLAYELGDFDFVLTGGREDIDPTEKFLGSLPSDLRQRFRSTAGSSFDATLGLLQDASLLVSVNTGIMHVGAAMGVPTVGLHGPTNPLRWGPIGQRVRSVSSKLSGAGALNLGFEYQDDTNYMTGLDPAEVLTACRELLGLSAARG